MSVAIVTDSQEAEISGSAADLLSFQASLARLLLSGLPQAEVETIPVPDPSPYRTAVSRVLVRVTSGPTNAYISGATLVLEGSRDNLQRFGSYLRFEAAQENAHVHFEHSAGNAFVAPQSLPLVISCRGAQLHR